MQRARRVAGWAGLGFVFLQLGWVLVMPPATGIDEFDHVYRASAVSLGHWEPSQRRLALEIGRGGLLPVRRDLVQASEPACARLQYTAAFNCRPFQYLDDNTVEVASGAADYNPVFYAVIGTLSRPLTGNAAIYAMRTVAVTLCGGTFTFAVFLTAARSRTRWPTVAALVAALPTTVYSTSVAAPNGLNMMSGLLVWAAVTALLRDGPESRGPAYLGLTVGFAVLANTHTLGVLWVGLIAVTVVAYTGLRSAVALVRPRGPVEWTALVASIASLAFAFWWIWHAKPNMSGQPEGALHGSPWGNIAISVPLWFLQSVGAFPLRNEPAPMLLYAGGLLVMLAFGVPAIRALRREGALLRAVIVLLALSLAVPVLLTYHTYETIGLAWQGRYGMPYSVGLFLLIGLALDRRLDDARWSYLAAGVTTWVFTHVVGQLGVLTKQEADHHLVAATGWWAPPAVVVAMVGLLAAGTWMASLRVAAPTSMAPTGPMRA